MIAFKLLFLEVVLVLLGFLLMLALQRGKDKTPLVGGLINKQKLNKDFTSLPSLKKLLELEVLARKDGSGIEYDSLIGIWKFVSVWKQGTDEQDSISSSLLRLFSASLELRKYQTNNELHRFDVSNSIQFGVLKIRFFGSGELEGPQPLLLFYFEF